MRKHETLLLLVSVVACTAGSDAPSEMTDAGPTFRDAAPMDANVADVMATDIPQEDVGSASDAGALRDALEIPDALSPADSSLRGDEQAMFILQGQLGRTALSCDGGENWIHDAEGDDSLRCRPSGAYDCGHDSRAGRGLAFAEGVFFAAGGFGVARSRNGRDWEPVLDAESFGALAAGGGHIVAAAFRSSVSVNAGDSWAPSGPTGLAQRNVRRGAYLTESARFVLVSSIISRDEYDLVLSDDGREWRHPTVPPDLGPGCLEDLNAVGGIVQGNGVTLAIGSSGVACVSDDAGDTWRSQRAAPQAESALVWTGREFVFFAAGRRYGSPDGETWRSEALTPAGLRLGALEYGDGRFVAVNRGGAYETQTFHFSDDGLVWHEADTFSQGHPAVRIRFGRIASALAACSE